MASGQWAVASGQWITIYTYMLELEIGHCPLATVHWPLATAHLGVSYNVLRPNFLGLPTPEYDVNNVLGWCDLLPLSPP